MTRKIGIGNRGNAPLILSGVQASPSAYRVDVGFLLLNPGEVGKVDVVFEPEGPGEQRGSLVLDFGIDGTTIVIRLSGTGLGS